jgi:uncharacterized protein YutD
MKVAYLFEYCNFGLDCFSVRGTLRKKLNLKIWKIKTKFLGTKWSISNEKTVNYKAANPFEFYNFGLSHFFIRGHLKNLNIHFKIMKA